MKKDKSSKTIEINGYFVVLTVLIVCATAIVLAIILTGNSDLLFKGG